MGPLDRCARCGQLRAEHELLGDVEACAPSMKNCACTKTKTVNVGCPTCYGTGLDWNGDSFSLAPATPQIDLNATRTEPAETP